MSYTFRMHYRAPPSEHATAVLPVAQVDDLPQTVEVLDSLPRASEWFREGGNRLKWKDKEIHGMSLFRSDVEPTWEDPLHQTGQTVRLASNTIAASVFEEHFQLALAGFCLGSLPRCTGVKLVDKSNKTRVEHRLELWYENGTNGCDEWKEPLDIFAASLGAVPHITQHSGSN